jgi:hypothetical protein
MEINEYLKYREDLLVDAQDEDGFVSESRFLDLVLPSLSDAKLIDSEDYTDCYLYLKQDNIKINGYKINESEERLQIFIVNEESIDLGNKNEDILVSQKSSYDAIFGKVLKFVRKAIKRQLDNEIQDAHPIKPLINFIASPTLGLAQIDVIELFLVSATATVEKRGEEPTPKMLDFEDEEIPVVFYDREKNSSKKNIHVFKRLIDLNFLYNVLISQGNREVLEVDFERLFHKGIHTIKAADEENFESYLCVLPASVLAELYKRYSTRMLEKNVRSFLQFKGVNQGIRDTIRRNPEHFIAYNNGLTITAIGAEIEELHERTVIKSLKDFQIVNGGQTTATIYFSQKDGLDISKVKVMAKINVAKNANEEDLNELISNISRYSNAQSKVSNADLRSRNQQLIRLKSISESTLTPSGKKWFFERFKGEFNTLLRKDPKGKTKINNLYPKERRFTKEELAKYYMSWGQSPHLVKKGGDKIFRTFIEELSPEKAKEPNVNRDFYEHVIARLILFKELEKIYGAGKNSMGQLRSAVVPYAISVLYIATTGSKSVNDFDLFKIWQAEKLDDKLKLLMTALMQLVNELIKKYSQSEDYGEYSKRKELWDSIALSQEIKEFTTSSQFLEITKAYSISQEELKKRLSKNGKAKEIDFGNLYDNVKIFSRGADYYKKLLMLLFDRLSASQKNKVDRLIYCINQKTDIDEEHCDFEKELIHRIRVENPDLFDSIQFTENEVYLKSADSVVKLYNSCIENGLNITSEFEKRREISKARGLTRYSVFDDMAKGLSQGKSPSIKQIYYTAI